MENETQKHWGDFVARFDGKHVKEDEIQNLFSAGYQSEANKKSKPEATQNETSDVHQNASFLGLDSMLVVLYGIMIVVRNWMFASQMD